MFDVYSGKVRPEIKKKIKSLERKQKSKASDDKIAGLKLALSIINKLEEEEEAAYSEWAKESGYDQ